MPVFGQTRAALAAAAARGADILSSLRLVMTAEALTAPVPAQALELNTELEVLCDACRELAACRGGWLYARITANRLSDRINQSINKLHISSYSIPDISF